MYGEYQNDLTANQCVEAYTVEFLVRFACICRLLAYQGNNQDIDQYSTYGHLMMEGEEGGRTPRSRMNGSESATDVHDPKS